MVSLSWHHPASPKESGFNYLSLKKYKLKSLKDKIESKELDKVNVTAEVVETAEETKPRVKRKK